MSAKTGIEWTGATWNPLRARNLQTGRVGHYCVKVSPGCTHCYAEKWNRQGRGKNGTKLAYTVENREKLDLFLDEKILTAPLRWRKPRMIFVCSMTDLFGDWVSDEEIDEVFAVMALAPRHVFQVLTKRAERMRQYVSEPGRLSEVIEAAARLSFDEVSIAGRSGEPLAGTTLVMSDDPEDPEIRVAAPRWPLSNCWLGVSAEDQQRLDERVPELLTTPAAVRFVSAEPLLGPLDFDGGVWDGPGYLRGWHTEPEHGRHDPETHNCLDCPQPVQIENPKLNWVIIGGESGPGARPMKIVWARDIVRQCREGNAACFVKQLGAIPLIEIADGCGPEVLRQQHEIDREWLRGTRFGNPRDDRGLNGRVAILKDRKGGDPAEWPDDLRVREFPEARK